MKRREFLAMSAAAATLPVGRLAMAGQNALGGEAFHSVGSPLRITGMKTFGVTLNPSAANGGLPIPSDRPYCFVKLETNEGLVGWGEGTLEGKASAVMACMNDFKEFVIGSDPIQVEHHWQSMYVHSFYRAGPVIGSAISGIDQALWDIRGKYFGVPVYQLLGGPYDPLGVRGYYDVFARTKADLERIRAEAEEGGVSALKLGLPEYYEWIATRAQIDRAVRHLQEIREGLGPVIDFSVDFHARTSPSVATTICIEVEPLKLLWAEEPCPPENPEMMARIARRTKTPIATGERLVAGYGARKLIEMGAVDVLQTDINHVGGITGLWKVGAMANHVGIKMAPHACEGPIGALSTIHVDSAMPNFLVQEICSGTEPGYKEKVWEEWFGFPAMRMIKGRFPLATKPGLGFELSEASLAKFPFGGSKPMARVFAPDGSVIEW